MWAGLVPAVAQVEVVVFPKLRSPSKLNRRTFLYGAGTTGLALPFLEGVPERSAFAAEDDPRFALFICTANGVVQGFVNDPDRFWPSELGPLTTSSMEADSSERCTGILADYADRLLIVRGMNHAAPNTGISAANGLAMCLTGLPTQGSTNAVTSTGPSADWVIARAAGVEPLTLYAGRKGGYIDEKLSFSEAGQVVAAEGDPYQVYLQLAGLLDQGTGMANEAAQELAQRRKSVNDLVREDLQGLLGDTRLSQADRQRLELHLQSIRDVEVALQSTTCSSQGLDLGAIESIGDQGFIEDVAQLQMQLAGLAFSCDLTRAATLQWGDGEDPTQYVIDGELVERFSHISNRINSDGSSGSPIVDAVEKHAEIDRIRMRSFKTLFDRWSELTTPQGPLFDSALVMWTCSKADGPTDSFNNLPIIIGGSPSGLLKQGQYIDAGGTSMARLLTTLIEVCGVDATNFADAAGGLIDVLASAE